MAKNNSMSPGIDLTGPVFISEDAKIDDISTFGEHSYIGPGSDIIESYGGRYTFFFGKARMVHTTLGGFCSIASNTRINAEQHPFFERVTTHNMTYFCGSMYGHGEDDYEYLDRRRQRSLEIGNDVWVGAGAVIMGCLKIGDGAVIGANAVVTHDVEPYQIVAGVPAKPIGYRFEPEIRAALQRIQWWNWSDEEIWARMDDIKNVPEFCRKYDPA
ncbi:MAG: acetyltransferase [Parasporobacterium sp.]|nr:acetyltransferase [Parasporobacterium sp.]